MWKACVEYFEWVEENPLWETKSFHFQGSVKDHEVPKMRAMTIAGLCIFLDIDQTTWRDYAGQEDFSRVTTRAEEIIRTQKFTGAAAELLNPNIIARDLGLADKKEHAHSGEIALQSMSGEELVAKAAENQAEIDRRNPTE